MTRARDLFLAEAGECLASARAQLDSEDPQPRALHAAVRRLRGSAQMARISAVYDPALALERQLRAVLHDGDDARALVAEARSVLDTLEARLRAVREGRLEADPPADPAPQPEPESEPESQPASEPASEPASPPEPGPGPAAPSVAELDTLEYRGDAALSRALALRAPLEAAGPRDRSAILAELFDLLELART